MSDHPQNGAVDFGRVLVVGGSGRLGRLLRGAWDGRGQAGLIWQTRCGAAVPGLSFDPLDDPSAYAAAARGAGAIFNLAGVTAGPGAELALNTALALAAVSAARAAGVPHVFLASSAAVYGDAGSAAREGDGPKPLSAYGQAKQEMELAALDHAARAGGASVTCLRIGNVAGADQLLGGACGPGPQVLDVFPDGRGPRRSYIGPNALATLLGALFRAGREGRPLPPVVNVALDGCVRMEDLLEADGRAWRPRTAPHGLVGEVRLDMSRLASIIGPVAPARAGEIVADFRSVVPRRGTDAVVAARSVRP